MSQPPQFGPSDEPQDPNRQPSPWHAPQPQDPGQWQPPQPQDHGQWQPPAPQPTWQPAPPPATWQPPAPGAQGWPGQQWAPTAAGQWEPLGGAPVSPQPERRGRGKLFASLAAVVVLAGGGVATYVAVSNSSSSGSNSPQAAVQAVVDDINHSDLAGLLDDIAPGERRAMTQPILDDIKELKRIKVLQPSADPGNVTAVRSAITGLKFAAPVRVNDHVQIAQLTGGTVRIQADPSKIPFTTEFMNALFPNGGPHGSATTTQADIAQAVQSRGGKPIRIATQKVDGHWYASLFYTIADNAASDSGLGVPTASDAVAAKGAPSPVEAVKQEVGALLGGDLRRALELMSPDELAAVHDYGGFILDNAASSFKGAPLQLEDLQLTASAGPNGTQRVQLKSVKLTENGETFSVALDGDCVRLALPGQPEQRVCAAQAIDQAAGMLHEFTGKTITPAQRMALTHLFGASTTAAGGFVVSQSGGQWFVNPVRTVFESTTGILGRLQGDDVLELIKLFRSIGNH